MTAPARNSFNRSAQAGPAFHDASFGLRRALRAARSARAKACVGRLSIETDVSAENRCGKRTPLGLGGNDGDGKQTD